MRDKAYKFVRYAKKNGIGHATKLAVKHMSKAAQPPVISQKKIYVMADIDDIVMADFIHNPYIPPAPTSKKRLRIAWVLSPVSPGSGGQNTITRFARYLQNSGHDITIYIYEGVHPQRAVDAKNILKSSFSFDVDVKAIEKYEDADVVIATGWETAYPVFNLKTKAHKFYFVQDFEPLFYGLGSMATLAENTYRFNFYGITAGKWLKKKVSEYGMRADHFDFGVDVDIYKPTVMPEKKRKISFYARPVTERRAFELGVIALDIFHKNHPEYEIEFFGWDVSEYKIPFPYINRGVLTHKELATLYQESVACLVLSLTNVSLLPFELLAAGCIPVMNDGENNRLVLGQNEFITYTGSSPVELADGLETVVSSKSIQKTATAASNSVEGHTWESSYAKVEAIITREVSRKHS